MGLESNDIDIALDNIMGEQFAHKLKAYLDEHDVYTSSLSVIKANPEKSKHLETATIRIKE